MTSSICPQIQSRHEITSAANWLSLESVLQVSFRGYGIFFDRYVLANLMRAIDKKRFTAFEQVADGNASASLFAATEAPAVRSSAGRLPIHFRPTRHATPYSQQPAQELNICSRRISRYAVTTCLFVGLNCEEHQHKSFAALFSRLPNAPNLVFQIQCRNRSARSLWPGRLNPQFNDIYQRRIPQGQLTTAFPNPSAKNERRMEFSELHLLKNIRQCLRLRRAASKSFNLRSENAISRTPTASLRIQRTLGPAHR